MAERQWINQVCQIGVEATAGTAVAANKRLSALSLLPNVKANVQRFRPQGYKYPTVTALGKEWTEAPLSGVPTYTEIVYPLSSVLGTAVIDTPVGGTASRTWTFTPSTTVDDAPKTFTIEMGSAVRAHRITYGIVDNFILNFDRDDTSLSGSVLGRRIEDGITLTPTPTEVALVPAIGAQFSVYMDSTSGGLGTTKLLRVLNGSFKIQNRFGPLWVVDAAQASWVTHLELEPTLEFEMTVEADAAGMGLLSNMRAGDTRFFRIAAAGPIIEGALSYQIIIDFAGKVGEINDFSDEEGVYAIKYVIAGVHDGTWGKSMQVIVQNNLTAL